MTRITSEFHLHLTENSKSIGECHKITYTCQNLSVHVSSSCMRPVVCITYTYRVVNGLFLYTCIMHLDVCMYVDDCALKYPDVQHVIQNVCFTYMCLAFR